MGHSPGAGARLGQGGRLSSQTASSRQTDRCARDESEVRGAWRSPGLQSPSGPGLSRLPWSPDPRMLLPEACSHGFGPPGQPRHVLGLGRSPAAPPPSTQGCAGPGGRAWAGAGPGRVQDRAVCPAASPRCPRGPRTPWASRVFMETWSLLSPLLLREPHT